MVIKPIRFINSYCVNSINVIINDCITKYDMSQEEKSVYELFTSELQTALVFVWNKFYKEKKPV